MPIRLADVPPDPDTAAAVRALAREVEEADGAPPLSDAALARLRSADARHLVARDGDTLAGYLQRTADEFELVARPDAVDPLLDAVTAGAEALLVWSHGHHSRLVAPFEARGYERARELFQLRRPADVPLPEDPPLAEGVTVRAFSPGHDEDAWLAVNREAFAHHPEQAAVDHAALAALMAENWFDPDGFLLAERDGELLGFHWTKRHADAAGEVYVLGVSPRAQGLGLGNALLVRGLRRLHDGGAPYVLLYVDGDNPGAVRLYERQQFTRHDVDSQWRTAPNPPS
ncbi:GNAT family N-acetyltransferase [Jatrophihabitans fulvus]